MKECNVQAQGQAGFTALSFELPVALAAMMNFEKPPCPLVPCSALLGDFNHLFLFPPHPLPFVHFQINRGIALDENYEWG